MDDSLRIKTEWPSAKVYIEAKKWHSQSEKFAFLERYWYQRVKNILFAGGNPFASSEELESYVRYSARLKWSLLLKRTAVVHRVAWKRRPRIFIKMNILTEIQQSLYQMAFGSAMDEIRFILSHFYYGQRTAEYPKEFHAVRSIMLLMIACGFVPQKAHERSDDYFEYRGNDILKTYHQVKDIIFMKKKIVETYRFPWVHNHKGCIRNDTTYKVFIEKMIECAGARFSFNKLNDIYIVTPARLCWWWYWYLVLKRLNLPFFMMPREIRLMIRNRI